MKYIAILTIVLSLFSLSITALPTGRLSRRSVHVECFDTKTWSWIKVTKENPDPCFDIDQYLEQEEDNIDAYIELLASDDIEAINVATEMRQFGEQKLLEHYEDNETQEEVDRFKEFLTERQEYVAEKVRKLKEERS